MAIDTSQLTDYSWADIKKAAKQAMMTAAIGGTQLTINGRSIGRITPNQARQLYDLAEQELQRGSSATGTLTALGDIGRAS